MTTFKLTRGDTFAGCFTRKDKDGETITDRPDSMYLTVKRSFEDSEAVVQKRLEDFAQTDDGAWHFELKPEDTSGLAYGCYVFDIQVTVGNIVKTINKSRLELTGEATWASNEEANDLSD